MFHKLRVLVAVCALVVWVAGCKSAPPPPKPTVVKARIVASANINPRPDGGAQPVHVRVFQLKYANVAPYKASTATSKTLRVKH